MRAFERGFREQHAVVGDDAHGITPQSREAGNQRRAVAGLEFLEVAAVDQARDDLAHVVGLLDVRVDDAVDLLGPKQRLAWLGDVQRQGFDAVQAADDLAGDRQCMVVVLRKVIGDAGDAGVHVGTAQLLGTDDLAGRRLDQRWSGEKDRALLADDDRLVRHRRHVRPARGTRAHHHADLRDALRRHRRLIVENAAEMIAVRKDVGLIGQVRAPGVDQVDARQIVLARDVLGAQMFLHRHRVIRAALHGRVVADDHAFVTRDPAEPGDDAGGGDGIVVHAVCGKLGELEKRRSHIEQRAHSLARQQLAASGMSFPGHGTAALLDLGDTGFQVSHQCGERVAVAHERGTSGVEAGFDDGHDPSRT